MGAGNLQTGRFYKVPSPYRPYRRPAQDDQNGGQLTVKEKP